MQLAYTRRAMLALASLLPAACRFGGDVPPIDPNFSPSRTYSGSYDELWNKMVGMFQHYGLAIVAHDQPLGQMTTDYQALQGSSGVLIPGSYVQETSGRVKWTIFFERSGPRRVIITVRPTIEASTIFMGTVTGTAVVPYRDSTAENPGLAQSLTKDVFRLYEQVLPPGSLIQN